MFRKSFSDFYLACLKNSLYGNKAVSDKDMKIKILESRIEQLEKIICNQVSQNINSIAQIGDKY